MNTDDSSAIFRLLKLVAKAEETAKSCGFGLLIVSPDGAIRHIDPTTWGAEDLIPPTRHKTPKALQ